MATEITLTFYTNEDVTPEIFAQKIAKACARQGAIRIGERVAQGDYVLEYTKDIQELGTIIKGPPYFIPHIEEIHNSAIEGHINVEDR